MSEAENSISIIKLNPEETASYLSKEGKFAQLSETYEERTSQIELVKDISKIFNKDAIGIFEVGTGVGKSFSYLIPSMLFALFNNQRVVISTGTINLQQQLVEKDISFAKKILGKDIKSILVKGRQNFICKRRLSEALSESDLFSEDTEELGKIEEWAKTSQTGSRSELTFNPLENTWQKVNSESDGCLNRRCPFFESCFVMKMRKEASEAQILVVNHHLLFADIESRLEGAGFEDAAVLPPYKRLVLDEAHGIENAATSFFSESFSKFKVIKQLNLLYRQKRTSTAGLIYTLEALSDKGDYIQDVLSAIHLIKEHLDELDAVSLQFLQNDYSVRLVEANAPLVSDVLRAMRRLKTDISSLSGLVREMIEGIPEDDREGTEVWEARTIIKRIENVGLICGSFLQWDENKNSIFWFEKNKVSSAFKGENTVYVRYVQTPLEIAQKMNTGVFEPMESVVCTSATLKTGENFNFWMNRCGLFFADKSRLLAKSYPSPFPYKSNVLTLIPQDIPAPDSYAFQEYIERYIPKLIRSSQGRCIVLFTSYDSLRKACEASRIELRSDGFSILKQGDDDRFRLLETFKKETHSVLFATDSFWEGVDVPGESLSHVIIVKLPFKVPSDPVFSARCQAIEEKGRSSFMELSLPDSIIKFRQGFGRLIRHSTDTGVVTILDNRVITKRYGQMFLSSIPETKLKVCRMNDCLHEISSFLT